jgi:hypothetical protein
VINPWSGEAKLHGPDGDRSVASRQRITFETNPGGNYRLVPIDHIPQPSPIPVARNEGPKWPFHQIPGDTIEAYMKRTESFGMLGITKDGQNLTRNKVRKALAEQAKSKGKE